jgi:NAD(P) transhydrogenase
VRYLTGFGDRDIHGVGLSLPPEVTLERLASRTSEVIRTLSRAIGQNLEHFGIDLIHGTARLQKGRAVLVTTGQGQETLSADAILIATGSRPRRPGGIPGDDPRIIDSETVFNIGRLPESIVIIGGGAVGCEYASIFTALGTKVVLVEAAERLLPFMDSEITGLFAETQQSMGVRLCLSTTINGIEAAPDRLRVTLSSGERLEADDVMFAAGRQANTEGLALEEAGVRTRANGYVVVDERFRTSAEGIYAAGDVTGPPGLASVAAEQGRVAATHAFGLGVRESADPVPPFGVYAIPEVAMIGMTEDDAREQGVDYVVGRGMFTANPRAWIGGSPEGMVKLVFRRQDRVVLGVHIMTDDAADLIHLGQALVRLQLPLDYLIETTFNAPTFTEAYKTAAYDGLMQLRPRTERREGVTARQGVARG